MAKNGWLKLHRQCQDSRYYSMGLKHIGMFKVLLVKANWKPGFFQGVEILPGSFGTSISGLAEDLGEDRRTIRKVLDDLELCGMITRENVANRWTHLTICNWEAYQQSDDTIPPTDDQPDDQPSPDQVTTIEEVKKLRTEEERVNAMADLEQIAFQVYGSFPIANINIWLESHDVKYIKKAMAITEASDSSHPNYTTKILGGWARDGYPEENKDGRGNTRDTVTVNAGESESEGPCPYEARVRHIEDLPDTGQDPF